MLHLLMAEIFLNITYISVSSSNVNRLLGLTSFVTNLRKITKKVIFKSDANLGLVARTRGVSVFEKTHCFCGSVRFC